MGSLLLVVGTKLGDPVREALGDQLGDLLCPTFVGPLVGGSVVGPADGTRVGSELVGCFEGDIVVVIYGI